MAQTKKAFDEVRIPFANMSFTPDVPSTALGPNEYNSGQNIETDVRGIRSVSGEQAILPDGVPGTPTFISSGYRNIQASEANSYYFIVATVEGYWYAANGSDAGWVDITPPLGPFTGYTQATNITEAWNGTVPFFCDGINPPIFWGEVEGDAFPQMTMYSNIIPVGIFDIVYDTPTTQLLTFSVDYATPPYLPGDKIQITDVSNYYNGLYTVVSCTVADLVYLAVPGGAYGGGGTVSPAYTWNYNPLWKSYTAAWMRLYNTPNVGCILVAGNLTVTDLNDVITTYPTSVQWSQKFGLNEAPATWAPTIVNVANQFDAPLRGASIDAFPSNGNLYICSYWDTCVLSPMNYTTTQTSILGVRLVNQGRGLLTANCWANTDKLVYGIDSRDIWVFDGQNFNGLGNQKIKNWFFNAFDPLYVERIFMETNTQKNQIEIYFPDLNAINGVPNKMISYRYDLDIWNPPRDVNSATFACESPVWTAMPNLEWTSVVSTAVTGTGTGARFNVNQQGNAYKFYANQGDIAVAGSGYVVGNVVKLLGTAMGGASPANDCIITVLAINGTGGITNFNDPTGIANGTWDYSNGSRTIVYARGDTSRRIVQKDVGYNFLSDINGQVLPIVSKFRRDNIKMLQDYSGKLLVHRILPEIINLNNADLPIDPTVETNRIGSVSVKIEGANSVGQAPVSTASFIVATNTDTPWAQINQNAHRVNSIELSNSSTSNSWLCSATTWQFTQTEDDR